MLAINGIAHYNANIRTILRKPGREPMNQITEIHAGQWGKISINFSDEPPPNLTMNLHSHDSWEIFCWLGSRMTYHLDGKAFLVPHSAVVAVPPGVSHRTQYSEGELRWKLDLGFEDRFFQIFPSDQVRSQVRHALSRGMLPVSVKWANELRQSVIGLLLHAKDGGPLAETKAVFAVASLLSGIAQAASEDLPQMGAVGMRHTHVAAAMELINQQYMTDVSLPALAQQLHLTKTYLCHIFHDVLGMTVSEYVRSRRVQAARLLLLNSRETIAEIAEKVGFCNVNYFTKCFRAEEGVTPSQYRTIVLGGK